MTFDLNFIIIYELMSGFTPLPDHPIQKQSTKNHTIITITDIAPSYARPAATAT